MSTTGAPPLRIKASMAMISVVMVRVGTSRLRAFNSPSRPLRDTNATTRQNMALPMAWCMPKTCSNSAPPPADITTNTANVKNISSIANVRRAVGL